MNLRSLAAALVLSVPASVLAAPVAEAAPPQLTVTWPETTRFNPDTTDYTVEVRTEPGADATVWMLDPASAWESVDVPPSGRVTLTFPRDGSWDLSARACRGTECTATSRYVEVQRDLDADLVVRSRDFGPARDADVVAYAGIPGPPSGAAEQVEMTWMAATPAQPEVAVASGTQTFTTGSTRQVRGLRLPTGTPDGTYDLTVRFAADTADYGRLEGVAATTLRWDSQAPEPVAFTLSDSDLYPYRDKYRDSAVVKLAAAAGSNDLALHVLDSTGLLVDEFPVGRYGRRTATFDARAGGQPLPEGSYTVQVVTTDRAGNSASTARPVQVHPERLFWQEVGRTFKASDLVVDRYVGPCGSLVKSPRGLPKKSLGYYSNDRCGRSRDGTVATVLGASLPLAFEGKYRGFRVTVTGGAARSARESRATMSYFNARTERFSYRNTLTSKQGRHRGRQLRSGNQVVADRDTAPAVYWSLGVGGGSRYEVRTFTLDMERLVLGVPTSSRTLSRPVGNASAG